MTDRKPDTDSEFQVPSPEAVEDIEFVDPGRLVDDDLELRLIETTPADHERGFAPEYRFAMILVETGDIAGNINLRVGHTEHLRLFRGHIGFGAVTTSHHPKHRERSKRRFPPCFAILIAFSLAGCGSDTEPPVGKIPIVGEPPQEGTRA